ncbi:hypothetical protein KC131_15140 [Pseudomonas sp. JQ170]|uniref:Rap1a/Tai family immunity protein n=1 Tax=unclassified Pseudomonas TaxID=196821 RepID=UPI00264DD424|nr:MULTISPECIES: Rap1a/Tai family immunity protein [unclassified Pseudomonas]MDN7141981.1 hypothetical protein [Pseudomonas sp. JQ170]WRO78278.1 Rap1a/Tai family immunity protein [Pseudomonas sp. 170C]
MKRRILAVALSAFSVAAIAEPGRVTNGQDLLTACKDFIDNPSGPLAEQFNMGYCAGMIPAVGNSFILYKAINPEKPVVCIPEQQFTQGQAIRVVIKYLEDHPESLHKSPMELTSLAYLQAYPCKGSS